MSEWMNDELENQMDTKTKKTITQLFLAKQINNKEISKCLKCKENYIQNT